MYLESMYMLSLNVIFSYNYIIAFFVESILHVKYILQKPYLDRFLHRQKNSMVDFQLSRSNTAGRHGAIYVIILFK